jgi:uncharacterized protein YcbX
LGIFRDRQWIIVHDDEKRGMVTQREFPKMALIKPSFITTNGMCRTLLTLLLAHVYDDAGADIGVETLQLSFPGHDLLTLPLQAPVTSPIVLCDVWDSKFNVRLYGDESATWLQNVIGTKCRIGTVPDFETYQRSPDARWDPSYGKRQAGAYADDYPFLV